MICKRSSTIFQRYQRVSKLKIQIKINRKQISTQVEFIKKNLN